MSNPSLETTGSSLKTPSPTSKARIPAAGPRDSNPHTSSSGPKREARACEREPPAGKPSGQDQKHRLQAAKREAQGRNHHSPAQNPPHRRQIHSSASANQRQLHATTPLAPRKHSSPLRTPSIYDWHASRPPCIPGPEQKRKSFLPPPRYATGKFSSRIITC
jgi:hypothetical protein